MREQQAIIDGLRTVNEQLLSKVADMDATKQLLSASVQGAEAATRAAARGTGAEGSATGVNAPDAINALLLRVLEGLSTQSQQLQHLTEENAVLLRQLPVAGAAAAGEAQAGGGGDAAASAAFASMASTGSAASLSDSDGSGLRVVEAHVAELRGLYEREVEANNTLRRHINDLRKRAGEQTQALGRELEETRKRVLQVQAERDTLQTQV